MILKEMCTFVFPSSDLRMLNLLETRSRDGRKRDEGA